MPSNWNTATGAVETLHERYQREALEEQRSNTRSSIATQNLETDIMTNKITLGSNATLLERMTYTPGDVHVDELLDALAELEAWRDINSDHRIDCVDALATPEDTIKYISTLQETQLIHAEDYKKFWDGCIEAAGGAHAMGYPEVYEPHMQNVIFEYVAIGSEYDPDNK